MHIYERLKYLRKELNLTQKEISEVLGVAPNTYAMIETGRRSLRPGYIKLLKYQFNINEDWLLNGEGSPFYVSPKNAQLIEQFEKMSPKMQDFYLSLSAELIALDTAYKKEP